MPGWLLDRRLALAAIGLLALAVRLVGIDARLSHDEGYSWLVATAPSGRVFLDRLAAFENTPPLFYALLVPLPHTSEAWLRVPSLIAGTAAVPVIYAVVRPLLGTSAALIAALGLAVAPYHVSFSDYSRGFMVAGLGVLLALWAACRLVQGRRRRWWWLYTLGAVVAIYSEYHAGLFLAALLAVLLVSGRVPRREVLAFGIAPALAFLPWVHQLSRSLDAVGKTKQEPISSVSSSGLLRHALVPLFFGEHGKAPSGAIRWVQLALIVGMIAGSVWLLWRRSSSVSLRGAERSQDRRLAVLLIGGAGLVALALQLMVHLLGPDIFAQRYLTVFVPVAAAIVAGGIVALPWEKAPAVAAAGLVALGLVLIVRRAHEQTAPDVPRALASVRANSIDRVLTNTAVVLFYGRDLRTQLDRPLNLGPGLEARCLPGCPAPYAVVDDASIGAMRPRGPGMRVAIPGLVVRLVRG